MNPDDSASPPDAQQICFRIADLADCCRCAGPRVFRFLDHRTLATTGRQYSAFVEAARSFLQGEKAAFEAYEISFSGVEPSEQQLTAFANALSNYLPEIPARPTMGRYWTGIEIPDVGTFDGVSFWLSYQDLSKAPLALATAIELLGLRNPVYMESIDQCVPEISSMKSADSPPQSRIDPKLSAADICDLLTRAMAPDPKLSRKQWEIVSECRSYAYDLARAEAEERKTNIDTSWRWNRRFNRIVTHYRALWITTLR